MKKYVKKTDNEKMGRPELEIDWEKFELACSLLATQEEICGLFGISDTTLQRRIKEKYNDTFEGVLLKKGSVAKVSLRRNQFNLSKTNPVMCIWLGKQHLGQRDILEHSGIDGEPIEHTIIVKPPFEKMNEG